MTDSETVLPVVLVIDDDPTVHMWAKRHLSSVGYQLISALNGRDGVTLFHAHFPDIVLIDVEMPDINGFETCAEIRRLPEGKNTPILMVTGTEDAERVSASFNAGATDFVVKPVNWKVLIHRLSYMIKASSVLHQLEKSELRLSRAQQLAKLGHWELALPSGKLYWSDEIYGIFQQSPVTFSPDQQSFLALIHEDDRLMVEQVFMKALAGCAPLILDYRLKTEGSEERFVEQQIETLMNAQNELTALAGTIQDISERKAHEKQVRHLAYYDDITGLPNRSCFLELLSKALELAKRYHRPLAVLFLDLDGFKNINDGFGHPVGDLLLKDIAKRLTEGLRRSDIAARHAMSSTIRTDLARLGGDEFTILLNELNQPEDAALVAQNIQEWLAEITSVATHQIAIGASIGIALYPQDGGDAETLLKNADIAMYHAKKSGKSKYMFFHEDMNIKIKRRQQIEYCMRQAIANHELRLFYQPVVNAVTGLLVGAEALMRWESPELGFLPPNEFISIAEENGFIIKFGEWAIREVCRQHKEWQKEGMGYLRIAVNLSSPQLNQPDFVSMVQAILAEYEVDPGFLVFELTETIIMANTEKVVDILWQLKKIGIRLSIDDFGTGYSSLSYLKNFPLDSLKIDRSFVKDLPANLDDAAIVKAILLLASTLNLHTVAEGVETIQQRDFLISNTCESIQGFLFAKPLTEKDFRQYWQNEAKHQVNEGHRNVA